MKPDIGLTEKQLHKSISPLTSLLSDEMVLYCKTRKFHWNVSGESFMELHKLFQAQYTQTPLEGLARGPATAPRHAEGEPQEHLGDHRQRKKPAHVGRVDAHDGLVEGD